MANGKVKVVNEKGFGFITPDGAKKGDKDIFFHASGLMTGWKIDDLHPGMRVAYDVKQSDKGPRAEAVTPIE